MPWILGIDEAGYGPNLGPFVMSSVACRVPEALRGADLWQALRAAVRRRGEKADRRLLVEDSKVVYNSARGLLDLETGVLAAALPPIAEALSLAGCIERLCPAAHPELRDESWYTGTTALPIAAEALADCSSRFAEVCGQAGVAIEARSVVVCPTRFNDLIDRWDSKAVVLSLAMTELLRHAPDSEGEAVFVFVDKHGGRNTYAAVLQHAFPGGLVIPREEGKDRSVYEVTCLKRPVELTFQPRADGAQFCVALASMVSKYLREVLMLEFNRFWQAHVAGLKPTAGYPVDAARFFAAIRPALERLGIAEAAVWRKR
jgi:hypothetical protein